MKIFTHKSHIFERLIRFLLTFILIGLPLFLTVLQTSDVLLLYESLYLASECAHLTHCRPFRRSPDNLTFATCFPTVFHFQLLLVVFPTVFLLLHSVSCFCFLLVKHLFFQAAHILDSSSRIANHSYLIILRRTFRCTSQISRTMFTRRCTPESRKSSIQTAFHGIYTRRIAVLWPKRLSASRSTMLRASRRPSFHRWPARLLQHTPLHCITLMRRGFSMMTAILSCLTLSINIARCISLEMMIKWRRHQSLSTCHEHFVLTVKP